MTIRASRPWLSHTLAGVMLAGIGFALAGCGGAVNSFDPTDMLGFLDQKKPMQGERKPVFPEGVPGVQQGVPKELYKGAQPQNEFSANPAPVAPETAGAGAAANAAPVAEERQAAPPPPKKPARTAKRRSVTAPPPDPEPAAAPPPPPPQQPAPQQQQLSPFPAPLPSGSFQR